MKKLTFLLVFFLALCANAFGQTEPRPTMIYLKDGSQLRGTISTEAVDGKYQVQLTDGSLLEIAEESIAKIERNTGEYRTFGNGRRVLTKGWYQSFGFHTLTAKRASQWMEGNRWNLGGHFSVGHQFSPKLGFGAGLGVDVHEAFFVPVFLELQGVLVGEPDYLPKNGKTRFQIPITYGLQMGYNVALEDALFANDDNEKINGSWLLYPSVGLMLPSRRGANFRVDIGYKFQRYTRSSSWPWNENYHQKDVVMLKSFALRAGWVF